MTDETIEEWAKTSPPPYLYRYMPLAQPWQIDRVRRLLVEGELTLSSPSAFNDPFDCLPVGEVPRSRVAREMRLRAAHRRTSHGVRPDPGRIQGFINSPAEMADQLERSFRSVALKAGVACFSEVPDSVLMWSHYADNHKGVVVRFAMRFWPVAEHPLILKVKYSQRRPRVRLGTQREGNDALVLGLTQKADFWAYEAEWRLIVRDGAGATVRLGHLCVDSVICGFGMEPETTAQIDDWCSQRMTRIPRLTASLDRNEFRVNIER